MRTHFLLCLLLAGVVAKHKEKDTPECMWHAFLRHNRTSAWEFQAQPNRHMVSASSFTVLPRRIRFKLFIVTD
jgi:hypothetical protein